MTDTTAAAGTMLPGTYIRRRREAAGLSLEQVASWVADDGSGVTRADIIAQLRTLESGATAAKALSVEPLKGLFAFDPNVYLKLVFLASGRNLPVPPICRVCACTEFDACLDSGGERCGWAKVPADEAPLCTMCIPDPGEGEALQPPANDGEEVRDAA